MMVQRKEKPLHFGLQCLYSACSYPRWVEMAGALRSAVFLSSKGKQLPWLKADRFHPQGKRTPGGSPMEKRDEELILRLAKENETLRKHVEEHRQYEEQLEEYNKRLYLSTQDWMERKRIQKLKLAGRDKIEQILAEYRRVQKEQPAHSEVSQSPQTSN